MNVIGGMNVVMDVMNFMSVMSVMNVINVINVDTSSVIL